MRRTLLSTNKDRSCAIGVVFILKDDDRRHDRDVTMAAVPVKVQLERHECPGHAKTE